MNGLVIDGVEVPAPGLMVRSWKDDRSIRLSPEDGRPRTTNWIRQIILHTTVGDEPQIVRSYSGPAGLARRTVSAWGNDSKHAAGAHIIIDGDGSIWCLADLVRDVTYHAGKSHDGKVLGCNEYSIGIEIAQTKQLEIFASQTRALILLLDFLTRPRISKDPQRPWSLMVPRQFHAPYRGDNDPVPRLAAGGKDCCGIFGHRDQTHERGKGDPGDFVFHEIHEASYEMWDFAKGEDLRRWELRQKRLNDRGATLTVDGVPGPATVAATKKYFTECPIGVFVNRPGDVQATTAA